MYTASSVRPIRLFLFMAVIFLAGTYFGISLGVRSANAASGPRIEAFTSVINGKLDVFAPGVTYKTLTTQNAADFMVTKITSIKRHRHDHSTEFLYVVSGSGLASVGPMRKHVGPGDMIAIPMGTPHALSANGAALRFVEVDVPSIAANDVHWMR